MTDYLMINYLMTDYLMNWPLAEPSGLTQPVRPL
jgi:hypothetical protein